MKALLFCFALFITVPQFVLANSYSVTPLVIERDVSARDMLEETIKVTNTGTVPVKLFPSVNAITLGEDGSIEEFISPVMTDQTTNVASWLAISRARIELAPGETKRIPLSITVNPQAVPGEYYALIGFGSGDKRDEAEAMVMAGRAPGVTVRLAIADKKNEYLRLHSFVVDRFVTNPEESLVRYELENIGDTAITPKGEIIIYDVRGKEVGAVTVNGAGEVLEPSTRREFTATLPSTGIYGRHKAFLNLEYGSTQRANLYDTTFFTVVPILYIVIAFGVLLFTTLILTLLYIFKQRRHHHIDDESVAMYIRDGVHSDLKDHDINLKRN